MNDPAARHAHARNLLCTVGVFAVITLSLARIVPTYNVFTQTFDEPLHLACGYAWLDRGLYDCLLEHPPLVQIAIAVGPYLKGIKPQTHDAAIREGNEILYWRGEYFENLTLARIGTLPFFVLTSVVVYLWGRRWFDAASGFWSVLLFVSIPPILGHSGLATLDIAGGAGLLWALYQWMRWLETPTWRQVLLFAAAISVAVLTKFSNIVFLPVCMGMASLLFDRMPVARRMKPTNRGGRALQLIAAAALVFVAAWACYGFTIEPIVPGQPAVILAPMLRGLLRLYFWNSRPAPSYFFGQTSSEGWWEFFPVALAVKTPIGFQLLALAGIVMMLRRLRHVRWQWLATVAGSAAILLICMSSRINVGVRHIFPIYPLLALLAGYAVGRAFEQKRRVFIAVTAVLVLWVAVDSWRAHPDYLAYFNTLAGEHPEAIVAESDLDWGQDLHRLSQRLAALGVEEVAIRYFGTARLEEANLPRYRILDPDERTSGYLAVSVRFITREYALSGAYAWVRALTPIERVGKSIFLYHVPSQ